ncbi:hypothetical protein QNH46_11605 [Paenibacillus woosongensis]|uniref:Uncharacterized protein n=1 Tax=Paenibacillus woosongensis TaxID=307580 RepID=A0AA95L2V5_9BACL|nr:hypothetical protein [Paenibacillus woosongensis]WHX51236.1 hypothetical protein QNH46_11605 [Paenibacillus woosongensis]GIP56395.1 hypothetical protein J15TS10_02090 [Paenibacillus woosongensis]
MNNSKGIFYYIAWMIGACLLVYYSGSFFAMMDQQRTILYKTDNMLLANMIYAFAFGLYLSLLNGWPARRKMIKPLFFGVFLPCFLILIYPIASSYIKIIAMAEYYHLVREREFFFFGLMSGLTLMKSFFTTR